MPDPSKTPTQPHGILRLTGAMMTDVGMVRPHNEDSVMYRIPGPADSDASRGVLAIVADGMGGHAAGEVASQIATRSIHTVYYESDLPIPETLARAFATANLVIRQQAGTAPDLAGMGTTCTVLAARDGHLWLGHIGDSRAYMLRAGEMKQLSEDDTLVARLVRDGTMTAEEARNSPERSVLVRALGVHDTVEPMIWNEGLPLRSGDRFVLCSDGLHDLVDNASIQAAITEHPPSEACRVLVQAARETGGHDNISVGVFTVSNMVDRPAASERGTREVKLDDLGRDRA